MSLKFPDHNKNHKTIYPMIIVEIITVLLNYVQDYKNIYNPYWFRKLCMFKPRQFIFQRGNRSFCNPSDVEP